MRTLSENLRGQDFADYITAHLPIADTLSLTRNRWPGGNGSPIHTRVLEDLSAFYIRTVHTTHWFSFYVPPEQKLKVCLFRFNEASMDILLSHYDSIFYSDGHYWKRPEDLCFFKDSVLVSGSVTHERICFFYNESLPLPGVWETEPSALAEQISLNEMSVKDYYHDK